MKEVKMEMKFIFGNVCQSKKNKITNYISKNNPIDIFFGIGQGRVYVEEGRFNTESEGKRKLLDNDGYFIDNQIIDLKNMKKIIFCLGIIN